MGSLPERVTPRRHAIRKGVTCRELVELITNYLEDEMPPDERTRFEQHLGYCESCVIYLSQIRRTVDSWAVSARSTSRLTPATS